MTADERHKAELVAEIHRFSIRGHAPGYARTPAFLASVGPAALRLPPPRDELPEDDDDGES